MRPIWDLVFKGDNATPCSCKLHVNGNQVWQTPFWIGNLNAGRQEVPPSAIAPFMKFTLWVLCQVSALVGNALFLTDDQLFADIAISAVVYCCSWKERAPFRRVMIEEGCGMPLPGDIQINMV